MSPAGQSSALAALRARRGVLCLLALLFVFVLGGALRARGGRRAVSGAQAQFRLDPNTACRDELMLLPGIGPSLADAIIAFREAAPRRPAFVRPEDLDAVRRIGPATVARLAPLLRFPAPAATSSEQIP